MENYEELVALLGHENAHINERQATKMMCRNLASVIFISVVLSDVKSIMAVRADNARQLQSLSFSRELEADADKIGIELMHNNNIDPQGMADLFSRLNSVSQEFIPEFLSSHLFTDKRIESIEKMIGEKSSPYEENQNLKFLFEKLKE